MGGEGSFVISGDVGVSVLSMYGDDVSSFHDVMNGGVARLVAVIIVSVRCW